MSALSKTSLTSMKAAFPAAPDPIQGIPTLASLINLMLHICQCLQTQKTTASATMNMLFTISRSWMKLIQSQISQQQLRQRA
jgi:hypothetical protein